MKTPARVGEAELRTIVAVGREQRDVEFKTGGSRKDRSYFANVTRAVLAMANRPGGGLVVLGVAEDNAGLFSIAGLDATQIASWSPPESVLTELNLYAVPSLALDVYLIGSCLAIRVGEFDMSPVLCRRALNDEKGKALLTEGTLYYRTRRRLESAPIASLEDWQELLEHVGRKTREATIASTTAAFRAALAEMHRDNEKLIGEVTRLGKQNEELAGLLATKGVRSPFGEVAGIFLGNFIKFQRRSKQTEARANLKAFYTGIKAFNQETGRYPASMAEVGFDPYPGGRYVYLAGTDESKGGDGSKDHPRLLKRAVAVLSKLGVRPRLGTVDFLVAAVTDFDSDDILDVWTIGPDGEPRNVTPSTTA